MALHKTITLEADEIENILLGWIAKNYRIANMEYDGNEVDPVTDAMTFTFLPKEDDDGEDA